jgi:hypothetical protein
MRVAFLVYGVLYVVIEIVGYQLEQVSWPAITALDVATAVTNAFLTVAVLVAALVTIDVLGHRWRRHLQAVRLEEARLATEQWTGPEPITVPSWRPEPLALPAGAPVGNAYAQDAHAQDAHAQDAHAENAHAQDAHAENAYARRAWPEDASVDASGRLL